MVVELRTRGRAGVEIFPHPEVKEDIASFSVLGMFNEKAETWGVAVRSPGKEWLEKYRWWHA